MEGAAPKRSLLDIQNDFTEFFDLVERLDPDEITEDEQKQLDAFYEGLSEERDKKLDNIGAFIKDLKARAKARKEVVDSMKGLYQTDVNKVDRLMDMVLRFFQSQGIDKAVDTMRCKFWRQRNGQPALRINEDLLRSEEIIEEEIPERFHKRILTIDTAAVTEELKALRPIIDELQTLREDLKERAIKNEMTAPDLTDPILARIEEIEGSLAGTAYDFARLEYGEHLRVK